MKDDVLYNTDIVDIYNEHVDEKHLDELANECYYQMSFTVDVNCADVKEAYKRGYRDKTKGL